MNAKRSLTLIVGLGLGTALLVFFPKPEAWSQPQEKKATSVEKKLDEISKRLERIEKKLGIVPSEPTTPAFGAETKALPAARTLDDISGNDIFEGKHRKFPKTSVVHGGESEAFQDVNELIGYFESPKRKQEKWMGKGADPENDQQAK